MVCVVASSISRRVRGAMVLDQPDGVPMGYCVVEMKDTLVTPSTTIISIIYHDHPSSLS